MRCRGRCHSGVVGLARRPGSGRAGSTSQQVPHRRGSRGEPGAAGCTPGVRSGIRRSGRIAPNRRCDPAFDGSDNAADQWPWWKCLVPPISRFATSISRPSALRQRVRWWSTSTCGECRRTSFAVAAPTQGRELPRKTSGVVWRRTPHQNSSWFSQGGNPMAPDAGALTVPVVTPAAIMQGTLHASEERTTHGP